MACGPVPSPRSNVSSCQPSHVSLPGTARGHYTTILSTGHTARLQAWGRGSSPHGQLSSAQDASPEPTSAPPPDSQPVCTLPLPRPAPGPLGKLPLWVTQPGSFPPRLAGETQTGGTQGGSRWLRNLGSPWREEPGSRAAEFQPLHSLPGVSRRRGHRLLPPWGREPGVGIHTFLLSLVT